jgi:hypothetical protein
MRRIACFMQPRRRYFMHFLEESRFPKAPVLVRRKESLTLRPAKSADLVPPPTSQCLGKTQLCQSG